MRRVNDCDERWLSPEGEVLDTCTILTTEANARLRGIHDRMPVIVPPDDYARWLDAADPEVADLFAAAPDEAMRAHPVSTRVNAVRNDDPTLIDVVEEAAGAPAPADDAPAEPELPLQPRLI